MVGIDESTELPSVLLCVSNRSFPRLPTATDHVGLAQMVIS